MATLSELEAFRDGLLEARASGLSRLSIRSPVTSREIEYRSDAELAAAIADIERRIAQARGVAPVQVINVWGRW